MNWEQGERLKEDKIDHKAGIIFNCKIGDKIGKGDIIGRLYSDSSITIEVARERILRSITISREKPSGLKLIKKIIA